MEKFENPIYSPETPPESSSEEKPVESEKAEKEEAKEKVDEILVQKERLRKEQEELLNKQMEKQIKFQDELIQGCNSIEELTNVLQKYGGLVRDEGKPLGLIWYRADYLLERIKKVKESGNLMKMHGISGIREKLGELLGLEKEK